MFYDLNLPYPNLSSGTGHNLELRKSIDLLIKFGYQVVAFNHILTGKKSAKITNPIQKIETHEAPSSTATPSRFQEKPSIQQMTRLTIIIDDPSQNYNLTASNQTLSTYDLLAVQPMNEKLFQAACSTYEIDIISLDMGTRLPFFLKHSTVGSAIDRGIYFEICYASAIRDSTSRRQLISNAQNLFRVTRGKNIIISGGAQKAMELRGPYDIVNLGTIMGMNQAVAKDCISTNCRAVLYHAFTRRDTHKAVISSVPVSSLKPNEMWTLGRDDYNSLIKPTSSTKRKRSMKAEDDGDQNEEGELDQANFMET
ncbi:hypothetical protein G9A89_020206 [Geosiphon pyriformis]|nr:hypothetical protein G9A89_020206 [Geosiphon pyriformis]